MQSICHSQKPVPCVMANFCMHASLSILMPSQRKEYSTCTISAEITVGAQGPAFPCSAKG